MASLSATSFPSISICSKMHYTDIFPSVWSQFFGLLQKFLKASGLDPFGLMPALYLTQRLSRQMYNLGNTRAIEFLDALSHPPYIALASASYTFFESPNGFHCFKYQTSTKSIAHLAPVPIGFSSLFVL